ncbi:hypothetical protein TRIATDRAFT_159294, partial [Trichoderma atroviride IMI 206040]
QRAHWQSRRFFSAPETNPRGLNLAPVHSLLAQTEKTTGLSEQSFLKRVCANAFA